MISVPVFKRGEKESSGHVKRAGFFGDFNFFVVKMHWGHFILSKICGWGIVDRVYFTDALYVLCVVRLSFLAVREKGNIGKVLFECSLTARTYEVKFARPWLSKCLLCFFLFSVSFGIKCLFSDSEVPALSQNSLFTLYSTILVNLKWKRYPCTVKKDKSIASGPLW